MQLWDEMMLKEWYSIACLMNVYGLVVFVLPGYVAESLGYLCLTFWDHVVVLSSSKQCLVLHWKLRQLCCLKTSGTIHPVKWVQHCISLQTCFSEVLISACILLLRTIKLVWIPVWRIVCFVPAEELQSSGYDAIQFGLWC